MAYRRFLRRLAGGWAILAVGSALAVAAALWALRGEQIERVTQNNEALALAIDEQTTNVLKAANSAVNAGRDLLAQAAATVPLTEDRARSLLRAALVDRSMIRALWVLDKSGRIAFDTDEGNIGVDLSDRPYFQAHRRDPNLPLLIGQPVAGRTTGAWFISVSRPMQSADGEFAGVIVAAVELLYFKRIWDQIDLGHNGSIAWVNRDGTLFMRSPLDPGLIDRKFPFTPFFSERLRESPVGTHLTVSPVDGSRRYVSYRVLSFYPEFVLLVGRSQDMALRTWWHFVEVSVIGWISAVAAAGGLLLWLARVRRRQSVAQDRAESELRRNENFYRLMFQANPHPMYVADAETLEFLAVNDAMADRYGWSRAEFLGMTVLDIRPADDVPRLLAAIEERPMNESQTVVGVRHRIKNGAVIEAETTSRMVEIDGGRVLIVLVHDVTARNRMMESLRENEALLRRAEKRAQEAVIRLQLAVRFGNVGLWDWDLASDEVYFSPEWKRQIGYEDDEIAGSFSEWETRLHPEDRARAVGAARVFIDSAERNGEYRAEFRLRHKDGSYRWILAQGALLRDENGRPVRMLGSHVDLTQDRRIEAALAESQAWLSATMANSPLAVTLKDARGRYLFVNEQFSRWHGVRDKGVQGKTVAEAFPDRDAEGMEAQERELMTTGVPCRRVSGFRFHDGTMHQLEVLKFLVPGPTPAICSMATDVTHQREVEEQLRQSQKMEAVGQLTGGIAHDFNNLLTVILGGSETLSEALAGDPHLGRLAEMVLMAAKRGADLTANLLTYSRRQRLDPRATDVNALVRRLHDLLRRTLGGQIGIELALDAGPSFAHVDASQLEAAILNLAINSRDAMPRGGKLTIRTAGVEIGADDARADAGAKPGSYLMVSVIDTGIGMSPEILARAFDPFFTTKDVGKGTGLGLSMVSGFAKQSGGHATIDSEEERGTVVTLYLPRVANAAAPGSATAKSEGTRGGNETILMVEDDAMLRVHVAKLLAGLGYRVLVAPNGAEALEILRRNPEVDLLFTDIVMPGGMDGSRLAAAARALRPELKVLFTTGHSNAALPDQSDPAGKIEMLNMPYRKADLAAKLRQVLDAN